jgi:hypothetical protein
MQQRNLIYRSTRNRNNKQSSKQMPALTLTKKLESRGHFQLLHVVVKMTPEDRSVGNEKWLCYLSSVHNHQIKTEVTLRLFSKPNICPSPSQTLLSLLKLKLEIYASWQALCWKNRRKGRKFIINWHLLTVLLLIYFYGSTKSNFFPSRSRSGEGILCYKLPYLSLLLSSYF